MSTAPGGRADGSATVVSVKGVNKHYGPLHVLKDINLAVGKGEVVVVLGPSGSGKSTMCRTINRLETIDEGEIRVDGELLPQEGKALAAHPGIDGLLFTGSARAGMSLHRQFADAPHKILALELGGNNPLVVWDAPDPHTAAVIAVQSAFLSAGQRCTAARRLVVEDGKHEALLAEIVKIAERLIVGEPMAKPAPFMLPGMRISVSNKPTSLERLLRKSSA